MKKLLLTLFFLLTICSASWGNAITPAQYVTCPTYTIYNCGELATPDSINIVVLRNGAIVYADWFNSADAQAAVCSSALVFTDQLQDIDDAGGEGIYVIMARAYDKDSTLYTPWFFEYEVGTRDTINGIMDSLQLYDGWVATSANQTLVIDTVNGMMDTLQNQDDWILDASGTADACWDAAAASHTDAGSMGLLQGYLVYIKDTTFAILDTLQARDPAWSWVNVDSAATVDTSDVAAWFKNNISTGDLTALVDTINAVLDTLQLYDSWVATSAKQTLIIDTVNATIDTLQNQDNWIAKEATVDILEDTCVAILDTLQLYDGWVATSAKQTLAIDSVNAILDTLQLWDDDVALLTPIKDSVYATLDTVQAQGSGGTTDTTKIKACASNNPSIWTDEASGGGSASCTLCAYTTEMEDGIDVTVRDSTIGNELANGQTGSDGCKIFNINPQKIIVSLTETDGITWTATADTFTLTSSGLNDTITGSKTTHSTSNPPKCTLFGYFKDIFGRDTVETDWQNYKISLTPTKPKSGQVFIDTSGNIIVPQPMIVTVNDTSYFTQAVYRTCLVHLYKSSADTSTIVDSLKYDIKGYTQSTTIFELEDVLIPDTSQYKISDLIKAR